MKMCCPFQGEFAGFCSEQLHVLQHAPNVSHKIELGDRYFLASPCEIIKNLTFLLTLDSIISSLCPSLSFSISLPLC